MANDSSDEAPSTAVTRTTSSVKTVGFSRLSNATTVKETKRMLVPARGAPVPIEVDENGDGVVADDKWSIFSRPKVRSREENTK